MPAVYLAMKKKFMKEGMSEKAAEEKAAKIFNSMYPSQHVGRGSDKKKER